MPAEGPPRPIVLVTPLWDTQPWYPVLLDLLVDYSLLIPNHNQLRVYPLNQVHPLVAQGKLQLSIWRVSGIYTLQRDFQHRLQPSSAQGGARAQIQHTSRARPSGLAGVLNGKLIPFRGMSNTLLISYTTRVHIVKLDHISFK